MNPIDWRKELEPAELGRNFVRGLFLLVPVVVTFAVLLYLLRFVDGWLNLPLPGLGLVLTVCAIVLVGRFASNVIVQSGLSLLEGVIEKAPLIKLLYRSVRELLEAFVGDKRRFDQPVLVTVSEQADAKLVGFVTRKELSFLGMPGHIAVYIPHAYNVSGHVVLLPGDRVQKLDHSSAEMMGFVVSGGVAGVTPKN